MSKTVRILVTPLHGEICAYIVKNKDGAVVPKIYYNVKPSSALRLRKIALELAREYLPQVGPSFARDKGSGTFYDHALDADYPRLCFAWRA